MTHPTQVYQELHYLHRGILDPYRYARQATLRCYSPSVSMQPFVDCYFVARWNRPGQPDYVATDILTKPVVNLFFNRRGAFVSNVMSGTRKITLDEQGVYAGIKFRPGAFHAFLQQPMIETIGTEFLATRAIPQCNKAFTRQLLQLEDDQELIRTMEVTLLKQRPALDPKIVLVGDTITVIETDETIQSVADLAAAFHISQRSLQYMFHEYVGVGVKWMLMRNRLLKTIRQALAPDKPNWTEIAAGLNYSTQSHFTNDFRRLLGISPSEYTKLVLRSADLS